MEKIVIFGGAFNPPHNLHFSLAEQIVSEYQGVQKIVFMPVNSKYQKREALLSNEHRYNMLKMVCDSNEKFEVSKLEIDSDRPLYTIETLLKIQEENVDKEILFTMGTDNLKEFDTWHEAQKILDNFKILVLERDEDNMEDIINKNEFLSKNRASFIKFKNSIRSNLSSTYIRKKIRNGNSIRYLTLDSVYNYIKQNKLYEEI